MTLPRLYAMARYWEHALPAGEATTAIAYGLGIFKKVEKAPEVGTKAHDAAVADFIAGLPIRARPRPA